MIPSWEIDTISYSIFLETKWLGEWVYNSNVFFSKHRPLGRFFLVVTMSVCQHVSVSPSHAILPGEQSQSVVSKSTFICCIFLMKTCVAKPVISSKSTSIFCNFLIKTGVAKPVGLLEEHVHLLQFLGEKMCSKASWSP